MGFRNVIFDLDGTLIDSLSGIEASARHAVAACFPERQVPPMRALIGPPIAEMFRSLWPELSSLELNRLVVQFRRHYDSEGCLQSRLYPGVEETLHAFRENGVTMFVLTNKPFTAARAILQHTAIFENFEEVVSPDIQQPAFTAKAQGAAYLQQKYRLEPAATLVVGDGKDDREAATACGFSFAAAAYGYGTAAKCDAAGTVPCVKSFQQIFKLVL